MKKSIFLFFAAILCAIGMNAAVPSKLYLDASGWGYGDARYAAYFMPQKSFVDMTKATGEVSVFEVAVPANQTQVIFVRMNGGTTENNWDNKWNQTGDLDIPTNGSNKFTPSGWDGATTTWSTYTYTPPTFYIAGDFVTPTWSENAAANKMDYADGVFSKSYDNVAASAHQFKITNGTWTNAIGYDQNKCSGTNCTVENGGGNIKFTPLTEGTVTITYTLEDGKVHITCPEPPAVEYNITYPATQTNYTLVAGPAKAQTGAEVSFTATPAEGYVLNVTYNGNVIAGNNNVYTFMMPATDVTVAITAVAATTLYYVDNNNWGNVNAYMWSDNGNNGSWPGAAMALVGTVGDKAYSYYSISFAQGAYTSIIFNGGGSQTADLTINTAQPYFYDGAWYTWDQLLAKLAAPVVTYDYYVIGTMNGWALKDANFGMTDDNADGVYEKEVTLTANNKHELKINNGSWDDNTQIFGFDQLNVAYEGVSRGSGDGDNNVVIELTEDKTITVKFDKNAGKITLDGLTEVETETLVYTVEVPEGTEDCYIAGQMNNWEFERMTQVNATQWTITYDNVLKTTEYKYACQADWAYAEVIEGGGNRTEWQELDQVEEWGKPADPAEVKCYLMGNGDWVNGVEMTLNPDNDNEYMLLDHYISAPFKFKLGDEWSDQVENYDFPGIKWENDNIELPEGIYDFYFKKDTKKAYIAAVYLRDVTNTWGTICLPHASTSFSGAKFYEVSSLDPTKGLWLDEIEAGAQLVAGKPYVFEATASTIKVTYTDAAVDALVEGANGLTGTFTDIAAAEDGVLVGNYIIGGNKVHVATAQNDLPANRAYIDAALVPNKVQAKIPGRRRVCMGENATTGLDQIVAPEGQAVKVIVNGQLIIIRDGVKYNVQGQKL